jgi:hypothetical protein
MKFRLAPTVTTFRLALLLAFTPPANASGPYTAYIKLIQATDVGNVYTAVALDLDITISPCTSTNQYDRYTITSNTQYATILAAFVSGRQITINGTGACNSGDIEDISSVVIR